MRLEIPDHKTLIHSCKIDIRWGDMDALGHVNNTVYFRFMEMARIQWLEGLQIGIDAQGCGPVIANAFCNFIKQLEYPGKIELRSYCGSVGHTSMDVYHEIRRTDDPHTLYANGGVTVVWVNYQEQKSVPIPDSIKSSLLIASSLKL